MHPCGSRGCKTVRGQSLRFEKWWKKIASNFFLTSNFDLLQFFGPLSHMNRYFLIWMSSQSLNGVILIQELVWNCHSQYLHLCSRLSHMKGHSCTVAQIGFIKHNVTPFFTIKILWNDNAVKKSNQSSDISEECTELYDPCEVALSFSRGTKYTIDSKQCN